MGSTGRPLDPLRKLSTRDAIDFSFFKQPSEYTADFLKKQMVEPCLSMRFAVARQVETHEICAMRFGPKMGDF